MGFLARNRPCLVGLHQPRVSKHVSGQYCRKLSFLAFGCHESMSLRFLRAEFTLQKLTDRVHCRILRMSDLGQKSPLSRRWLSGVLQTFSEVTRHFRNGAKIPFHQDSQYRRYFVGWARAANVSSCRRSSRPILHYGVSRLIAFISK